MRNIAICLMVICMLCVAFNSNAEPSSRSMNVLIEFRPMTNSTPDSAMNAEVFAGIVENFLSQKGIKPQFISKGSNIKDGYLDLAVNYLYVPDGGVRVLTLDARGINRKGVEVCAEGSNAWWAGSQSSQAIRQITANILSGTHDNCLKM
jgi:hypothetical protein